MTYFYSAPPCASLGQRTPSSAPTEQVQHSSLVPHVPPTQGAGDLASDLATPLWEKVVREYSHILQGSGPTFYGQFRSRVNEVTERTLTLAGHESSRPSLLSDFRGHCDLWEEVAFSATLAFVQSRAGTQDSSQNIDRIKASSHGEMRWDTMISPDPLSSLDCSNYLNLVKKMMSELSKIAAVLKGDIAPSIAAVMENETPLAHLMARTGPQGSTHDGTWTTIHQYAVNCLQKCDSAAENLDGLGRGIDSLICRLEERETVAGSLGAPPHVESAHIHSQMNEILRNTGSWIRSVQLTVQVLSIAHSTAKQIVDGLLNREHSDERMNTVLNSCTTSMVEHLRANSFDVLHPISSCSGPSGFGPPPGVTFRNQQVTGTMSGNDMEIFFEMNMADALTGNGLEDPGKAAFDTSRNGRKLGEARKQMKATIQFNDKLGQLQKTGQISVWTTANQVHMSGPRKLLLSAMTRAILKGIGVTKDETATGPEERYIIMATGESFDLKSVLFKSAKLLPCLKVIKVKLDWPDGAQSSR